jgi:hypothetical protein
MTRRLCLVLAALLLVLLLAGCARTKAPEPTPAPTPESTAEPTPTPTPEPTPDTDDVDKIGALIDGGSYYEAFRALVKLEEEYRDNESALKLCEAQFDRLDQLLREQEPETGTELSRTFTVQGGGVLEIDAFSGPVLVRVTDEYAALEGNPDPPSVTFYARQGETGRTNLPAGTYRVAYQVGYRWFGDETGFGEYCTVGELPDPLVIDFYMQGQWASYSNIKITL